MGHVLYGEADIGITNIDIIYQRNTVVDYSTPVGTNEMVILSKKAQPVSPVLNIISVFSPECWSWILALLIVAMVVAVSMDAVYHAIDPNNPRASLADMAIELFGDLVEQTRDLSTKSRRKSKVVFLFTFSIFGMFVISFFMKVRGWVVTCAEHDVRCDCGHKVRNPGGLCCTAA